MELPKIRPSMRSSWRKCPRTVYYRWVGGIEVARGRRPLIVGTAYHYGLETWRRDKDALMAAAAARNLYRRLCAEQQVDYEEATSIQVGAYVEGYARAFPIDGEAVLTEVPVFDEADAEGGTADSVMQLADGTVYVVEDKTTSRFDSPDAMRHALKMNDQIATYVAALRQRGVPVAGAFYRQVLKTQTKITKKETPDAYADRCRELYSDGGAERYRQFTVTWTDAELRRVRGQSEETSLAIVGALESSLEDWPFNPLSCIGPYGPCEYIKLCARGRDDAGEFKPTKEGPLDHGKLHARIWPHHGRAAAEHGASIDQAAIVAQALGHDAGEPVGDLGAIVDGRFAPSWADDDLADDFAGDLRPSCSICGSWHVCNCIT